MKGEDQNQTNRQPIKDFVNAQDLKAIQRKGMFVITGSLIGLLVFVYLVFRSFANQSISPASSLPTNSEGAQQAKTSRFSTADTEIGAQCGDFPDYLESCTTYSCTFIHPLTGDELVKRIDGLDTDGNCVYYEQLPNGGRMDCAYTESVRIASAQYYRDIVNADTFETKIQGNLSPDGSTYEATYTIDGKQVDNPLAESLVNGQCLVSGYN